MKTEENATNIDTAGQLYVLLQPTRQKIIQLLRESPRPMYITEIAAEIGESPRVTSFHLATLAQHGFVDGEFREIEPPTHHSAVTGRAAKYYRLTPKVGQVIRELARAL
ncbi:MAG: winged helix-turn-helix domain-containing protein [Thermoplasmata archaeon]|jgi:predicted transcriptional regulator